MPTYLYLTFIFLNSRGFFVLLKEWHVEIQTSVFQIATPLFYKCTVNYLADNFSKNFEVLEIKIKIFELFHF